jgi:hypothetical protein
MCYQVTAKKTTMRWGRQRARRTREEKPKASWGVMRKMLGNHEGRMRKEEKRKAKRMIEANQIAGETF